MAVAVFTLGNETRRPFIFSSNMGSPDKYKIKHKKGHYAVCFINDYVQKLGFQREEDFARMAQLGVYA